MSSSMHSPKSSSRTGQIPVLLAWRSSSFWSSISRRRATLIRVATSWLTLCMKCLPYSTHSRGASMMSRTSSGRILRFEIGGKTYFFLAVTEKGGFESSAIVVIIYLLPKFFPTLSISSACMPGWICDKWSVSSYWFHLPQQGHRIG